MEDLASRLQREQDEVWNGTMGATWVQTQHFTDSMLRPFEEILLRHVAAAAPRSVLDLGCGNGTTTLAFADAVHGSATVGIDLSEVMIENARRRAAAAGSTARFVSGDAATTDLGQRFDLLVSRFGVMFFSEPDMAFANLRSHAADGGSVAFLVWQGPAANPFLTAGQRAAAPWLPERPARNPHWPGPFSLADPDHTARLLTGAGFGDVGFESVQEEATFPAGDLDMFRTRLAPLGFDLTTLAPPVAAAVDDAVAEAYQAYVDGEVVRYDGACWLVTAAAI
ncbi:MAG: class I SAM-dependent methyltransferase [Actinomycetota bacterium]